MIENIVSFKLPSEIFETGELVMLKSSGPPMTVSDYIPAKAKEPARVLTDWFNEDGDWCGGDFRPEQLIRVEIVDANEDIIFTPDEALAN